MCVCIYILYSLLVFYSGFFPHGIVSWFSTFALAYPIGVYVLECIGDTDLLILFTMASHKLSNE